MSMRLKRLAAALAAALVLGMIASMMTPTAGANASGTVGAFLATARVSQDLVDSLQAEPLDEAAAAALLEFEAELSVMTARVEATYGSALDTTLATPDAYTGSGITRLAERLDSLNQQMAGGATVGAASAAPGRAISPQAVEQATVAAAEVARRVDDAALVRRHGTTYVLHKPLYNGLFYMAVVLLLASSCGFAVRLARVRHRGALLRAALLILCAVHVAVFAALLLPTVRAALLVRSGLAATAVRVGPEPRVYSVTPRMVAARAGATLLITGARFGGSGAPAVTIAGRQVTVTAWDDHAILIHLRGPLTALNGPQPVVIHTAAGRATTTVHFLQAAAPAQVLAWELTPTGLTKERFEPWRDCFADTGRRPPAFESGDDCPCGCFDQWREWFSSQDPRYWGRHLTPYAAPPLTGDSCPEAGWCATYPAERLAPFVDGRPDAYRLWVRVRTAAGAVEEHVLELRPGGADGRAAVAGVSFWMDRNRLMVQAPRSAGQVRDLQAFPHSSAVSRPLPLLLW
jgi:hypothetical protein